MNNLHVFLTLIVVLHCRAQNLTDTTTSQPPAETTTTEPAETCHQANNTLGTCECDKQFFIGEGCTKGFYCQAGTSDSGPYDGCDITCGPGNMLLVDPRNGGAWYCIRAGPMYCPGKFNTECACEGGPAECPIGDCECGEQLRVSHDCKTAKYCNADMDGFQNITCEATNEIVYVNLDSHTWRCAEDDGRCPGAFHAGCQEDGTTTTTTTATTTTAAATTTATTTIAATTTTTIPESRCTFANNTMGECGCGKQVFVGDDCTKGFYCMNDDEFPPEEDANLYDGCAIQCASDEILYVDPRLGGSWSCNKRLGPMPLRCPGKFNTECGCTDGPQTCPIGDCECDGQLRVSHDCKTARYCNETLAGGFEEITCKDDQLVYVNLVTHRWNCGVDDGRCPGAFHVGCQEDGMTTSTTTIATTTTTPTTQTTTTTTTTSEPDNGTTSLKVASLLLAFMMFFAKLI